MVSSVAGPLASFGGWYAGEVASGVTETVVESGQQALDVLGEPLRDVASVISSAGGGVSQGISSTVEAVRSRVTEDDASGGGVHYHYHVSTVEQAIEKQKHDEARELAGFGINR